MSDFVCSAYRKEVLSFGTSADKAMTFRRNLFREKDCRRTPKPGKSLCVPCAFVAKTKSVLICVNPRLICRSWFVPRLSSVFRPPPPLVLRPSFFAPIPKVKKCKKSVQNRCISVNFRQFFEIFAKKCKFLLIFTPIFSPKTNKSYKITLFAAANHPIFQNFSQKPRFF